MAAIPLMRPIYQTPEPSGAPAFSGPSGFKPVGADVTGQDIQDMGQNFDKYNNDQKASFFQDHLNKGLAGMRETLATLPPDIVAEVGDPSPYAGSDEKRSLWYMNLNQAINHSNMRQAAARGDAAGVEQLGLNDKSATPKNFVDAAENTAMDKFAQGFEPTKSVTKTTTGIDNLKNALVSQESGGDYGAVGDSYKKRDGSDASMADGDIALGKYQILPSTWFPKIGLDPTSKDDRAAFLADHATQDKAFEMVIQDALDSNGGDLDKAIATYYGGPSAAAKVGTPAADKPQSGGKPSINAYVKSVKAKMGSEPGSTTVTTEQKDKDKPDVALEILKNNPRIADKVKPLLDMLDKGDNGSGDYKAALLALKTRGLDIAQHNSDRRDKQFDYNQENNLNQNIQKYAHNTEDAQVIAQSVNDLDKIVDLDSNKPIPGVGWGEKPFRDWMLATNPASAPVRKLMASIFTRLGHKISGANFTEREMKNLENMLGYSFFDTEDSFRIAMRRMRSETALVLRSNSAALGPEGKRVAEGRGVMTDNTMRKVGDNPDSSAVTEPLSPNSASDAPRLGKTRSGLKYSIKVK